MADPQRQPLRPDTSRPLPFKEAEDATLDDAKLADAKLADAKLDDVMLAMDVVDTLRHERMLITRDIDSGVRRESLVDRLREIYRGQGITVPDDILMDGVKALEEERFRYQPPRDTFGTRLARAYVNRRRWLPLTTAVLALVALVPTINYFGFTRPAAVEQVRVERALQSLPADLDTALDAALAETTNAAIASRLEAIHAEGIAAVRAGDVVEARAAIASLADLRTDLTTAYTLEIVQPSDANSSFYYDPPARSGVDRLYYLTVDAVAPSGARVDLPVTDQITGTSGEVSRLGVQVPRSVYERVEADADDNGVIDTATIAVKPAGELAPAFDIPVEGGRLMELPG